MDVYLAIVSKREVRSYADRPLPDDAVRRLLEAGRLAGSSRNRQARRFVVLRDGALERAAQAVWMPDNLRGAALAVAILIRGKGPTGFDAGGAAQNMMRDHLDGRLLDEGAQRLGPPRTTRRPDRRPGRPPCPTQRVLRPLVVTCD